MVKNQSNRERSKPVIKIAEKVFSKKGLPKIYNKVSIPKLLETAKQRLAASVTCLMRYSR